MSNITEKPTGLPTGNTIDPDPLVETDGAYIGFRSTNIRLENPPEIGDTRVLMARVECIGDGHKKMADGELRDTRALKVLAVWEPGKKPADQDPNQPGLYEIDGHGHPLEDDSEDGEP